jgi:hypothetical protein
MLNHMLYSSEMEIITNSMNHYQIIWLMPHLINQTLLFKSQLKSLKMMLVHMFSQLSQYVMMIVLMKSMLEPIPQLSLPLHIPQELHP